MNEMINKQALTDPANAAAIKQLADLAALAHVLYNGQKGNYQTDRLVGLKPMIAEALADIVTAENRPKQRRGLWQRILCRNQK